MKYLITVEIIGTTKKPGHDWPGFISILVLHPLPSLQYPLL